MKRKIDIPRYAIVPMVIMLIVNTFTYNVTPIWTNQMKHFCLETKVDQMIPFVPIFVVPYILAYLQWFVGYFAIAKTEEVFCKQILYGEVVSKIVVCLIFLLIPSEMERAFIQSQDFFSRLVSWVYACDRPINLFPSIHCLESWICFQSSRNRKFFSKKYEIIMGCSTLLVFLSTVSIKQHLVVDIISAILVAELGLAVSRKMFPEGF